MSCARSDVPKNQILIRNDILDKEFNSFTIDEVISTAGSTGFRRALKPTEAVLIPHKHVTSLRFTRRYADFSRIYVVKCPADLGQGITVKLIDVHTNRLQGNCKTVKKGEASHGGAVAWEKG